jgi:hypothetical protein
MEWRVMLSEAKHLSIFVRLGIRRKLVGVGFLPRQRRVIVTYKNY